jgi:hypothetical protein
VSGGAPDSTKSANTKIDPFTVFNPLTVKLVMIDHMTHYVHDVVARFLVDYLGLAELFPWMSANFVSLLGIVAAATGEPTLKYFKKDGRS